MNSYGRGALWVEDLWIAAQMRERLAQPVIEWDDLLAVTGMTQEQVDTVDLSQWTITGGGPGTPT